MENRVADLTMVSNQVSFPFLHNVLFFLDLIKFWLSFGLLRFIIDMSPIEPQPFSPIAKISRYVETDNMFYQIRLCWKGLFKSSSGLLQVELVMWSYKNIFGGFSPCHRSLFSGFQFVLLIYFLVLVEPFLQQLLKNSVWESVFGTLRIKSVL